MSVGSPPNEDVALELEENSDLHIQHNFEFGYNTQENGFVAMDVPDLPYLTQIEILMIRRILFLFFGHTDFN